MTDEQTDARPEDASSHGGRGAYRNFLRPRRPSEIFATERGAPGSSAFVADRERRAGELDGGSA